MSAHEEILMSVDNTSSLRKAIMEVEHKTEEFIRENEELLHMELAATE